MINLVPSKLTLYLSLQFYRKFLVILSIFTSLIFFITYIEILRKTKNDPLIWIKKILLTVKQIPFIIEQILPLLIVISSLWAVMSLVKNSEIIIAKVAGVSQWKLSIIFGINAFLLGLFFIVFIQPKGTQWIKQYYHWKSYKNTNSIPLQVKITENNQDIIIVTDNFMAANYTLENITLYFLDKKNVTQKVIFSPKAIYDDPNLLLQNPKILSSDGKILLSSQQPSKILSLQSLGKKLVISTKTDHIYGLFDYPKELNNVKGSAPLLARLESGFYNLLLFPFFCGFLAALTVCFIPNQLRGSHILKNASLILLICFILFALDIILVTFGNNGSLSPLLAVSFGKIVTIILIFWVILKREYGYDI